MTPDLKAQRERRLAEVCEAFRVMAMREHPGLDPQFSVTMTDDAAIDLFGLGALDCPEAEWQQLLADIRLAEPEPVTAEDIARLEHQQRA